MIKPLSIVLAILITGFSVAQDASRMQDPYRVKGPYLGVGAGQDVGGIIGARLTLWPTGFASCFIGGGWALVGPAWSGGIELRVPAKARATPFFVAMYGYNAFVWIQGRKELNTIYYGPTLGTGVILRQRITRNYWRFSINLPVRSQEVFEYVDELRVRGTGMEIKEALPVTVGIGYHLCLTPMPRK